MYAGLVICLVIIATKNDNWRKETHELMTGLYQCPNILKQVNELVRV